MFDIPVLANAVEEGTWLGSGAARECFQISDKVVAKTPRRSRSLQSDHEIAFYEMFEDQYGDYMAKMYGYCSNLPGAGLVIFMEKVEPIHKSVYEFILEVFEPFGDKGKWEAYDLLQEIHNFESQVELQDSSDNPGNWGVNSEGKLVALDCGISYVAELVSVNTWDNGGMRSCYGDCDYCPYTYCYAN